MLKSENSTIHFECCLCGKKCKKIDGLRRHIQYIHEDKITPINYFKKYISIAYFNQIANSEILKSSHSIEDRLTEECIECGSLNCTFKGFSQGFSVFCTEKCAHTNLKQKEITSKNSKRSLLEKYGVDNASKLEGFYEKVKDTKRRNYGCENYVNVPKYKQTTEKRYGVQHYTQTEEYKNRVKETNLRKYGVMHFAKSNAFKEIIKQYSLREYGYDHFLKSPIIRDKIKETNLKRYGVKTPLELPKNKEKSKQKLIEKYGGFPLENSAFREKFDGSNRYIAETNEKVVNYLEKQQYPKPSYSTIKGLFPNETLFRYELEKYIQSYRNDKTDIEYLAENLLNVNHLMKSMKIKGNLYKPDFKLSDHVYLNMDGLYWHSELKKNKWYHFNLRKDFETSNLRIVQIRSDEIYYKPQIVKSIVNNILGYTSKKVYARNCTLEEVGQKRANIFLHNNHLKGSIKAKHIGLFYNDNLVSLLSYKQKDNICKIERFCSCKNTIVVGGYGKLISYLEKNYLRPTIEEIHNWVDLRYGLGEFLLNQNFYHKKDTLGWQWTDFRKTYNRLYCKANMDSRKLNQQQHAEELSLYKIYDAGQRLYVKDV